MADSHPKVIAAFEGMPGAHSALVLETYLQAAEVDFELKGVDGFRQAAHAVLTEQADLAIIPVDNVISGTVREGYDLLAEYDDLEPFAELPWRMDHRLLGLSGTSLSDITEILAHPLVLGECRKFLATLLGAKIIPWEDTGKAAAEVAKLQDSSKAAIAPPQAADLYGLSELADNVGDHPENITRFLLVRSKSRSKMFDGFRPQADSSIRKTSLLMSVCHQKGQLEECLRVISGSGINLTKLESRQLPGKPFEALFYIDMEGDSKQGNVAQVLSTLRGQCLNLQLLGSYDCYPVGNLRSQTVAAETENAIEGGESTALFDSKSYPKAARKKNPGGTKIHFGGAILGGPEFVVIAGPCSVESRDQVMRTASAVKECGAVMLRGGAFKPRTNPYSFQGLGWEGVLLLAEAGRAHGMPVVSEVMSLDQVDEMARKVDVLQIGARNMQNYDLLRKAGETDKPVLLKRGLSASIEEFLSAAEYVLASGNPHVILCERGIRTFETSTRFTLDLSAVPVLKERSHLPVIIDPSHGVGVRRWIRPLCRAAKAVGADGMIVEVHPNPSEAKSDKDQALTFEDFRQIMADLNNIPMISYEEHDV